MINTWSRYLSEERQITSFPINQAGYNPPRPPAPSQNGGGGYTALMYPPDLTAGTRQMFVQIQVCKYDRPSVVGPPNLVPINTVTLPIPMKINDINSVDWDSVSVSSMTAGAIGGLAGVVGGKLNQIAKNAVALAQNQAVQNGVNLGLMAGGIQINPFLTMMFKSQDYKEHTFQWLFAPNNAKDSNVLQNIILFLKKNMYPTRVTLPNLPVIGQLPIIGGVSFGLGYPAIMQIRLFVVENAGNGFLYSFKPAVLASLGIDRSAGPTPSFHTDGSPQLISVVAEFKEVELWFNDDFVELGANSSSGSGGAY